MNIKGRMLLLFDVVTFFLIILSVVSFVSHDQTDWLNNVFFDKVYSLILAPSYLLSISYIDSNMTLPKVIRIGSRTKVLFLSLVGKITFTLIYFWLWFMLIIVFSLLNYPSIYEMTFADMLGVFFRYFLGFILLSTMVELFRRTKNQYIAQMPYLFAYLILVIELLVVIHQIALATPFKIHILFSWVFYDGVRAYLYLGIVLFLLIGYLFKSSIRRDIL